LISSVCGEFNMNSISAEDYYVDFTEQQTAISFQSLLRVCKLLGFARKKHEQITRKGWTARVVLGNDRTTTKL